MRAETLLAASFAGHRKAEAFPRPGLNGPAELCGGRGRLVRGTQQGPDRRLPSMPVFDPGLGYRHSVGSGRRNLGAGSVLNTHGPPRSDSQRVEVSGNAGTEGDYNGAHLIQPFLHPIPLDRDFGLQFVGGHRSMRARFSMSRVKGGIDGVKP